MPSDKMISAITLLIQMLNFPPSDKWGRLLKVFISYFRKNKNISPGSQPEVFEMVPCLFVVR